MMRKFEFSLFILLASSKLFTSAVTWKPCTLEGLKETAQCGVYEVFENRETKARKIPIRIAVLRAAAGKAREPIFVLAGGPGQAATDLADFVLEHFAPLRKSHDLVFVDVRGTGESNPLQCKLYGPDVQSYFGDLFPPDRLKQCLAELEKRADLKLYTTTDIVKDLEEVRMALGYGKIDLYGTSYGTRVALVYERMYPDSLRAAILHGPAPTDLKAPLYHAWAGQKSLEKIIAQCEGDQRCRAKFPNVKKELQEILSRLDQKPASVELTDESGKKKIMVSLPRGVFGEALRNMLYNQQSAPRMPLLIHNAHQGDFKPFADFNLGLRKSYQGHLAFGLFNSVSCAEDVPFITREDVLRETRGTFLGDYRIVQQQKACEIWPRANIPPNYNHAVESNVPTLIVTGERDPVTPPRYGDEIAGHLSNAKHVMMKGGSHSGGDACMDSIMMNFFLTANPKTLDTSCASAPAAPLKFVLD